eukprot:TRINITY_DN21503_c0_g1_i1.p1 TRINITY_DN21503_c0_g1~~TRINITY_DN21503_c0_g1_i1.p1  ORF type:complete len:106 (+),score=4.60 TRINITY_DN21503_c0_g1_i1:73-390(+)
MQLCFRLIPPQSFISQIHFNPIIWRCHYIPPLKCFSPLIHKAMDIIGSSFPFFLHTTMTVTLEVSLGMTVLFLIISLLILKWTVGLLFSWKTTFSRGLHLPYLSF